MIYVFQGCGNICALPGKACEACGKACAQMKCDACKDCFDAVGKGCKHFMERPLSTFVLGSFILSAYQIYCCLGAMGIIADPSACTFPESDAFLDFDTWILIELGFAGINLLFAPYFQCRVWALINTKRTDQQYASIQPEFQTPGFDYVPAAAVQDSFKEVFCHDFLVLAYVIVLLGVAVISHLAVPWIENGTGCSTDNYEGMVRQTGVVFFVAALAYTLLWWCCPCCAKSVRIEKDTFDNA